MKINQVWQARPSQLAKENKKFLYSVIRKGARAKTFEVKSGTTDKKKSLRVYLDKYKPHLAVRCSPMNLKYDGGILNCPLYMLDQLGRLIELAIRQ